MKKVITYGTFDLLHYGHINLLKRAKKLGDYLIVGVTSDAYDKERGKLNVRQSLLERIENVKKSGFADEIIVEEYEGQKIEDIKKYNVDAFAIGSDWEGKFDYLREYCDVVYLERTRGVSSTMIRNKDSGIIDLGIIGNGRIANRFVKESKFVSGINITGVYNPNLESAQHFADSNELQFASNNLEEFLSKVNAVYIASPHGTHYDYIIKSLNAGKHVLCEKPITLSLDETKEVFELADKKNLVLMEAIKTAYCPGFNHLIVLAKSGRIGKIKDVEATFTKIVEGNKRELQKDSDGGSINELSSYTLLPIVKLLGKDYKELNFYSYINNSVDLYTRGIIKYDDAIATFKVGLGCKSEGNLIITGTKGYIYVPAPWWKTSYFEMRFENQNDTRKYYYSFDGDGLRYELVDFILKIQKQYKENDKLSKDDSIFITKCIDEFNKKNNVENI